MKRSRSLPRRLIGVLLVMAMVVAACGDDGSGADTTDATDAPDDTSSETTEATDEPEDTSPDETTGDDGSSELSGTVRWTMLVYDDGVQAWVDGIVEGFEEMHPEVTVEVSLPATNQYQDQITTQVQGGNPPDLSAMATAWVPAFADAGELENWSDYLDASFLDRLEPTLLAGAEYNDELVGLPYLSSSRALFYNQEALDAVGAEPPSTWEELIEVATQISEDDTVEYGFSFQGAGVEAFAAWFPYTYWASGGEFTTDGELSIDMDACVEAATILNDLVTSGATQPDVTSFDLPDQMGLFTSGDAAMTITGPWLIPSLESDAPDMDYGVAPIPAGSAGQATLGVQDAFVLFSNGDNTEAAVALAEYIYEPENADALAEGRGALPVLTEGFDAPRYQEDPLQTFVGMLPDAKFAPQTEAWTSLMDTGTQALQDMYVSGISPEDVCGTIAGGGSGL